MDKLRNNNWRVNNSKIKILIRILIILLIAIIIKYLNEIN